MKPSLRTLRDHAAPISLGIAALAIAWVYAATTLRATPEMGLPLDDSYIYLTYAKQLGSGRPFTYFDGGGYSAGATSAAWPMVLAPLWTLGARGHALVWVAYGLCALLYAGCVLLAWRAARAISGGAARPASAGLAIAGELVGVVAGAIVLGTAAFAWTALSGMEVALTSALLLASVVLLLRHRAARPSRLIVACLAATALARPEAAVVVAAICVAHAIAHGRDRAAALRWLAPLLAPVLWLVANRVFAGHWMPSTALAKSELWKPGFAWSAWWDALGTNAGKLVRGLLWDGRSPLPQARLLAIVWVIGAVRLVAWARAQPLGPRVAVAVILVGPWAIAALVLASSGLWTLHQYRYIAPMFPLLAIPAACALAPLARWAWSRWVSAGAAAIVIALIAWVAAPRHRVSAMTFAQGAADTNAQVVKLGRYVHAKLPAATVMLHDAGALAYYGDTRVIDMLGLVTDATADVANHGPGARFEYLESLPPAQRPTHFAYYPGWLGAPDFFGPLVVDTPLPRKFAAERIVGDSNMHLIEASWDHAGTGERPLAPRPGWTLVDRIDVADLASERGHAWSGALGVRAFADPSARWSFVAREVGEHGLVLDGGRTIRGGREAFTIARDPAEPASLVLRTGGAAHAPPQEPITRPITLRVEADGVLVGELVLAPPTGRLVEHAIALPAGGASRIAVTASGPYRVFHWFVLQPD